MPSAPAALLDLSAFRLALGSERLSALRCAGRFATPGAEGFMAEDTWKSMRGESPPEGEHIGAGELFRAHAAFVASFLVRLGVPAGELDDLVQEVFIVAHRKGGYVRGPAQPRSWLASIALRIAQAGRRARLTRNARESTHPDWDAVAAGGGDPGVRLEARRSVERVQRALETLPVDHRAALILYELDGESCESIAAVFEVPIGTIYSRLHSARRRFLEAYGGLDEAPASRPQRVVGDR